MTHERTKAKVGGALALSSFGLRIVLVFNLTLN
jgi:hypothetical protein